MVPWPGNVVASQPPSRNDAHAIRRDIWQELPGDGWACDLVTPPPLPLSHRHVSSPWMASPLASSRLGEAQGMARKSIWRHTRWVDDLPKAGPRWETRQGTTVKELMPLHRHTTPDVAMPSQVVTKGRNRQCADRLVARTAEGAPGRLACLHAQERAVRCQH